MNATSPGPLLNWHAIRAIYRFEMARTFRTIPQSIASPVLSTSLYFVVFGAAIGSRMGAIDGISYGAFIIPGLIMLSLLNESISNASFGIYMPKWAGTIYELLSAPVSYIEEAEEMADRIGVISKGELILVEDKHVLMRKLGKKQLTLALQNPLDRIPEALAGSALELADEGRALVYTFDAQSEETGIAALLKRLGELGIDFKDLHSSESSLEEIFVNLVHGGKNGAGA